MLATTQRVDGDVLYLQVIHTRYSAGFLVFKKENMLTRYESQRRNSTQDNAIESMYSSKMVGQMIATITHRAGQIKDNLFVVRLEVSATHSEMSGLRSRLSRHHFLEIVHEEKDGDQLVTVTVQRTNRK